MSESPVEKNVAKIITAIFLVYFSLLSLICLAVLAVQGTHGFGGRSERLLSFSAYIWCLQFFVLGIGVVRDKRSHEELFPKSLLVFFLGGLPSLYLVFRLLD